MTSNLTIAEKQLQRSAAQAQILEQAQNSALQKLSESWNESLDENLIIMQSATSNLCETVEDMTERLSGHLTNMNAATAKALSDYRETTRKALLTDQELTAQMLSSHRESMTDMMQEHNHSVKIILKEQAKPYLISALIAVAIILILGILFGLAIAKILS